MPMTNYPFGLSSFGIPVIGAGLSLPLQKTLTGKVLFVDSNYGSDVGASGTIDDPLATINAALALCTSGAGDTIMVMPGTYDENVVVSKDYVTIAGCVQAGYAKPDIVPTTGVALVVTGQGFQSFHCRYSSPDADVVQQQGNGFLYYDCVFDGDGQAATECLVHLLPSDTDDSLTASEGRITGCLFRGSGGIGIIFDTGLAPAVGVGCTDDLIDGNIFVGNTGIDIVTKDQGGGVYSVQKTVIRNNMFEDKNKACYIDLTTTNGGAAGDQTGTISGNYFCCDAITAGNEVKMVGTGFTFAGNYYTVGIKDGSGLD